MHPGSWFLRCFTLQRAVGSPRASELPLRGLSLLGEAGGDLGEVCLGEAGTAGALLHQPGRQLSGRVAGLLLDSWVRSKRL